MALDDQATSLPTLLVQPPSTLQKQNARMVELLFETFNVPGAFSLEDTSSALMSRGNMDGIVLDIGASQTIRNVARWKVWKASAASL